MDRIDALRLFTHLAQHRSITMAAAELGIKQSTASKWLAGLEAELGVALVDRTTRALRLTAVGDDLLAHARALVSGYDELAAGLRARDVAPSGRIRVSLPAVFGRRFVVPLVAEFLAAHPKVEAELILAERYVDLVAERFDLALRIGLPLDTSARARPLAQSRRMLVAAPDYLRRRGRPREPKQLREHDCIVHGDIEASAIWRFHRADSKDTPVPIQARHAANDSEVIAELARAGLGLALLADWVVHEDIASGRLVVLLADWQAPPAPIMALLPPGRFTTPAQRLLVDHLAQRLPGRLEGPRAAAAPSR